MRPIEFRAWDTKAKRFRYYSFFEGDLECVMANRYGQPQEYTGLLDKNGKKYWEDSLVRGLKCQYNDSGAIGKVYYNEHFAAYWVLACDGSYNVSLGNANWWEVIGDIHTTPKLLEDK